MRAFNLSVSVSAERTFLHVAFELASLNRSATVSVPWSKETHGVPCCPCSYVRVLLVRRGRDSQPRLYSSIHPPQCFASRSDSLLGPLSLISGHKEALPLLLEAPEAPNGEKRKESGKAKREARTSANGDGRGGHGRPGDGLEDHPCRDGDVAWLWRAELGDFPCVDLLLIRTLEELQDGAVLAGR